MGESLNAMKVIRKANWVKSAEQIEIAMNECNELVSIFLKSTTRKKELTHRKF